MTLARFRTFAIFIVALAIAAVVGLTVSPTWTVEKIQLDTHTDAQGTYYVMEGDRMHFVAVPMADAELDPARIAESGVAPSV
ncbi:MAG: hypothetical protein F4089_08100, partial [Gammaproteobacteria bacterium]|nr:hypothetical protein [Gammaproteobacteria bacterium]